MDSGPGAVSEADTDTGRPPAVRRAPHVATLAGTLPLPWRTLSIRGLTACAWEDGAAPPLPVQKGSWELTTGDQPEPLWWTCGGHGHV